MLLGAGLDNGKYLRDAVAHYRHEWQSQWIQPRFRVWQQMLQPERQFRLKPSGFVVHGVERARQLEQSQVVSTWPRSATSMILARYLVSDPVWRVETDDRPENETRAEILAPYLQGIAWALDEDVQDANLGYSWDQRFKASLVQFGKSIARPGLRRDGEYVRPTCALIDPSTFYHDIGRAYPCHYILDVEMPLAAIVADLEAMGARMPADVPQNDMAALAKLTHIFIQDRTPSGERKVLEAVLVNDKNARIGYGDNEDVYRESPYYRRVPYIITSMPPGPFSLEAKSGELAFHAEPIHAPALPAIEQLEALLSLQADAAVNAARPHLLLERAEGNNDEVGREPGGISEVRQGEVNVKPIIEQSGREFLAKDMVDALRREVEGIVPVRLIEAMSNPGDSALLSRQQIDEAQKALAPLTMAVTTGKQRIMRELLTQMVEDGRPMRVTVVLGDGAGESEGRRRQVVLKPDMLPDPMTLNVEEPIEFPKDALKQAQVAQAIQALKMLPDEEILRMVYKHPAPRKALAKARMQQAQQHPANQSIDFLMLLYDRKAEYEERAKAAKSESERNEYTLLAMAQQNIISDLIPSLLNKQSPRAEPNPRGIAPAQQSLEDKGANSLTDVRTNGRTPVAAPGEA